MLTLYLVDERPTSGLAFRALSVLRPRSQQLAS